jgi:hypothetical protein
MSHVILKFPIQNCCILSQARTRCEFSVDNTEHETNNNTVMFKDFHFLLKIFITREPSECVGISVLFTEIEKKVVFLPQISHQKNAHHFCNIHSFSEAGPFLHLTYKSAYIPVIRKQKINNSTKVVFLKGTLFVFAIFLTTCRLEETVWNGQTSGYCVYRLVHYIW